MTEASIAVITAAFVSTVGAILTTTASIFAAYYSHKSKEEVAKVHTLVNGHSAVMAEKLAITSEALSVADPTDKNLKAAVVTRDIADDFKKSGNPQPP